MKLPLNKIAEIVTEVTGVSLTLMRQKCSFREVVEARHIFMLVAMDHGIWTKKENIPMYLNISNSTINYADKQKYLYEERIGEVMEIIEGEKDELYRDLQTKIFRLDVHFQKNLVKDILMNIGSPQTVSYSL